MRSGIKNVFIKAVGILVVLFGFIFSLSAFGMVGDMINCEGSNVADYNEGHQYLQKNPNDVMMIYSLGIDALCIGETGEGIKHIENASNGGHIGASRIMALYYRTDGSLDNSAQVTQDPINFDKMIFYYEKAAENIESAKNYPKGVTEDMPYLEEHHRISAKVFVSLPDSYYRGYVKAIMDIMRGGESVSDTREVLIGMRGSAERCLNRPSLSVWNGDKKTIANALRVRCQAMWDFADEVIALEEERIAVAERQCAASSISKCSEHHSVVSQIANLSHVMQGQMDSVPVIY